jgi:redox-sensitive bicupin YhaK (pirin superfamily)
MLAIGGWPGVFLVGIFLASEACSAPLIDNERVAVWDVSLPKGVSGPTTPDSEDAVVLFLEGGQIRTVDRTGSARIAMRNFGDAIFVAKGTGAIDMLVSGGPAHEVMISLKDHPLRALANTCGYPSAFPRAGSVKVLDNSRFTAWHNT